MAYDYLTVRMIRTAREIHELRSKLAVQRYDLGLISRERMMDILSRSDVRGVSGDDPLLRLPQAALDEVVARLRLQLGE